MHYILKLIQTYIDWTLRSSVYEPFDGNIYNSLVTKSVKLLAPLFSDKTIPKDLDDYFEQNLRGKNLYIGPMHGDLSLNNIFITNGKLSGIIDWKDSSPDGLPALDILNLIDSTLRYQSYHPSLAETIPAIANDDGGLPGLSPDDVLNFLSPLKTDKNTSRSLVHLYWLIHTASQVPYHLQYSQQKIEKILMPVTEHILST